MNLKPIAQNQTELKLNDWVVFFSYQTPVVAWNRRDGEVYVTATKYSRTTTKHINKYLREIMPHNPSVYHEVEQSFINGLVK